MCRPTPEQYAAALDAMMLKLRPHLERVKQVALHQLSIEVMTMPEATNHLMTGLCLNSAIHVAGSMICLAFSKPEDMGHLLRGELPPADKVVFSEITEAIRAIVERRAGGSGTIVMRNRHAPDSWRT